MHYKRYKKILSPNNGMNLYRGCTHGCIYCDSRSKCYNMDHDFEDIEVKEDAINILENQLKRKRNKCMIGFGSMCDPYIHLEEKLLLTRSALEVIYNNGFGVSLITKSDRILRDLDLLKKINEKTKAVVQVTLTTYDDNLCKVLEPNVAVTSKRVEMLKKCKELNIPTVVWLCPILPFINDTEENLRGLLKYCFDSDVKGILCFGFGVTLREGNREYFYKSLDKSFPGLRNRYERDYGLRYELNSYNSKELMKIFRSECKKHNILFEVDEVFSYLNEFPKIEKQEVTLFDL